MDYKAMRDRIEDMVNDNLNLLNEEFDDMIGKLRKQGIMKKIFI